MVDGVPESYEGLYSTLAETEVRAAELQAAGRLTAGGKIAVLFGPTGVRLRARCVLESDDLAGACSRERVVSI